MNTLNPEKTRIADESAPFHQTRPSIMTETLTTTESSRLSDLEVTIERGLSNFIEVGNALLEIRRSRLYRSTNESFEQYCKEKWSMSETHANRLIQAGEFANNVKDTPMGVLPQTERVARPLASLPKDKQQEVWTQAVETAPNGKVTAKHVEEVKKSWTAPYILEPEVAQSENKVSEPKTCRLTTAQLMAILPKRRTRFDNDSMRRANTVLEDIERLLADQPIKEIPRAMQSIADWIKKVNKNIAHQI
jgi:hypothetical protein